MIMDPGLRTGLGWGTFKLEGDSFYAMFRDGLKKTIDFNYADEFDNAELAAQQWLECEFQWMSQGVYLTRRFFVVEKWIPNIKKFSMDESFASALAMTKLVQGMLYQHEPKYLWIMPGETHQVTNKQLRDNGLWVPGKDRNGEHQLDVRKQGIQALRKLYKTAA
jgi:hypothetical protein